MGIPPLAAQWIDFCLRRTCSERMFQALPVSLYDQRYPMTNMIQNMRVTICPTWAELKANLQSAWSKWHSPWINLPKGLCSPTLVPSTGGRNNKSLGFRGRSISPLSGDRTVWNSCKLDSSTGRGWLLMVWRLCKSGCFRNVQYCQLAAVKVGGDDIEAMCRQGSRGKEEGKESVTGVLSHDSIQHLLTKYSRLS
jgi:hypothetical protein